MGLAGIISSSVAGAANSPARWYALLIGIPLLIMTTRSVLRTLIVIRRLVWKEARGGGIQVLHFVTDYVIAPQAGSKHGTYGSLVIAGALLLGLFLISRLVVATAVVNALGTRVAHRLSPPRRHGSVVPGSRLQRRHGCTAGPGAATWA